MNRLVQKIHEGSRFGALDIRERLFESVLAAKTHVDEIFVDFKFVFEERDLEFFTTQTAAQSLHSQASPAVRFVRRVFIAGCAFHLARQKLSVIQEGGGIKIPQARERAPAMLLCKSGVGKA